MTNDQSNILVSICCITYNHAPFIRKALDGFLMQEPPTGVSADVLWYEILIHDDCSTDGTTEIIKEYAATYPDRIYPIYETENQYHKVGTKGIDVYNYNRVRGKYIAYCEGDDYWTDAHKLQKQVDFMETHQDYSICWHRCKHYYTDTKQWGDDGCGNLLKNGVDGVDIYMDVFFKSWYTQPLSMLFRSSVFDVRWRDRYEHYRDMHEIYLLLKQGKGYLFSFIGGVYTRHEGGISSMISLAKQYQISYDMASEWYRVCPDEYVQKFYVDTLQWLITKHAKIEGTSRISMIWTLFKLTRNVKHLIKNIFVYK